MVGEKQRRHQTRKTA